MKRKVTKVKNCKTIDARSSTQAIWRITGPCVVTKARVTIEFTGTREEAERVQLRSA